MKENEAVKSVANELSNSHALYGFKPDDVKEEFFIGETALVTAATVFIAAFLKGVNSALETKGKELGEKITKWLIDRLGNLFRKPGLSKGDEATVKKDMHDLSKSAAKLPKEQVDSRLDTIEKLITDILEKRGTLPSNAKEITAKVREVTVNLILQETGRGAKRR